MIKNLNLKPCYGVGSGNAPMLDDKHRAPKAGFCFTLKCHLLCFPKSTFRP